MLFIMSYRLYLHTKLANPHYRPEVAAQTTLVNFCVTEAGLEEQLLAAVVVHEQPALQEQAAALVKQLADFTLLLTSLEDNLLKRLAASQVPCAEQCTADLPVETPCLLDSLCGMPGYSMQLTAIDVGKYVAENGDN